MIIIGVNIKDDESYSEIMNLIDNCLDGAGVHHETYLLQEARVVIDTDEQEKARTGYHYPGKR